MKILIFGSSGILGNYLYKSLKKKYHVFNNGMSKRKYDLNNFSELKKVILKIEPHIIINCTAITDIDLCEKKKNKAYKINYNILSNIISIIKHKNLKTKIIQISTDQFYNNKNKSLNIENINKTYNYYCKTKLLSEKICIKNKLIALRTNFFGKSNSKNQSFSDWVYNSFKSKKKFYLFDNIYFSPLNLFTLSKMINLVIKNINKVYGVYNLGSKDCISKKDFAIKFAKKTGIYHQNFKSLNSQEFFATKRPTLMCMNSKKFEKKFKIKMPSIIDQINFEAKNYKM